MTICILSGITILSASCSTTHKNRSSRATSVDSTASVVNRQTNVSKDQTTISQQNDIQKTGNIKLTLIYDTGKVQINTVLLPTGNEDKSAINRVINALTNERLRRAELEGNFNLADKSKTVTNNNKTDSSAQQQDSKSHVKKTEEMQTLNKEVKGINFWAALFGSLWFWLIIAAIAAVIFIKHKLSIMNILKKIWPFVVAIMLFSCNNPDGKTYPADPEPSGWDHGAQTFTEYVVIKPTWGQAFYFAFKDGYTWQFGMGLFIIAIAVGVIYAIAKSLLKVNLVNLLLMFVLVAGGLGFIYARPGTIKWNNSIKIEKQRYEAAKDNLPAFWDQLYSEKRIVGTSGE